MARLLTNTSHLPDNSGLFFRPRCRRPLSLETSRSRPGEERAGQVKSTSKPAEDTAEAS